MIVIWNFNFSDYILKGDMLGQTPYGSLFMPLFLVHHTTVGRFQSQLTESVHTNSLPKT